MALLATGLTTLYLLQPPSADALCAWVKAATADGTIESFLGAESKINEFLERYSNDPRCDQLRQYQREIQLYRLQRNLEQRAKGEINPDRLLPIERTYLEAFRLCRLDPERGLAKLKALVHLYQDRKDLSGRAGQCLELARRHLEELQQPMAKAADDSRAELEQRLERAKELQPPSRPRPGHLECRH